MEYLWAALTALVFFAFVWVITQQMRKRRKNRTVGGNQQGGDPGKTVGGNQQGGDPGGNG